MKEFKEEQKMTQWWLWAIILSVAGFWVWNFTSQIADLKPRDITGLVVGFVIITSVVYFLYSLKLKTEFTENGIRISYWFLANEHIKWENIETAKIITYSFVGYGLRASTKYGMVYNASGHTGLFVSKVNGESC